MVESLDAAAGTGLHAGAGKGVKGTAKREYWNLFARLYSWVGGHVDVVMTNSSWTQAHIRTLWGPSRRKSHRSSEIEIIYPPVAVEELEEAIDVNERSEKQRQRSLLYIAQFRPEKNHSMILEAFAELINTPPAGVDPKSLEDVNLVLIGSVRDGEDRTRVYELRLLAHELKIKEKVQFVLDAS